MYDDVGTEVRYIELLKSWFFILNTQLQPARNLTLKDASKEPNRDENWRKQRGDQNVLVSELSL